MMKAVSLRSYDEVRPLPVQAAPEMVRLEAERLLRRQPYLALRHVVCDLRDGVLILSGRVPSYHLKQIAQTVVTQVEGMLPISNQIEVVRPD